MSRHGPRVLRGPRGHSLVAALLAVTAALAAAPAAHAGDIRRFAPVGDAYVTAAAPRARTFRLRRLVVSATPVRHAYLRFEVRRVTGPIARAVLWLRVLDGSAAGIEARLVARRRWSSRRLVYRGAPRPGARVASSGAFARGKWVVLDVSRAVAGNGTVSIVLTTRSRRPIRVASREAGPRSAPRLEVESAVPAPADPGAAVPATGAPVMLGPPAVSGQAEVSQVLTATPGTWSGAQPLSFTYQWRRCNAAGAKCADVSKAREPTYPLTSKDRGSRMRVVVVASNAEGSQKQTSAPTDVVRRAPTPSAPPAGARGTSTWHMDELSGTTMTDSAGANPGRLTNVTLGRPGVQNAAYGFDGASSVISVPSSTTLNPGASRFTFSVQVNLTQPPSASVGDYDLIRKGLSSTAGGEYKLEILGSGQALCHLEGSQGIADIAAGPNLADGAWHTIQCVKRDGDVSLVVDGQSFTKPGAVGSIANDATMTLGAKAGGGDWYLGLMDEASLAIG